MSYEEALRELACADGRYVVMTAENRGPMRGLPAVLGERFVDTGITEMGLLGVAAGLALRGRVPIAHCLACFVTMRGFEFARTDIGLGNLPVKIVGTIAGFLSQANGPTHQALEDVALMRGIPNVNVFCPADEQELLRGVREIYPRPEPWYIRYNASPAPCDHAPELPIDQVEEIGNGTDIALLTYGTLFGEAWKAREVLNTRGRSVRLVNVRTLKPLDEEPLVRAARECRLVVTLEDHFLTGGLATILAELLMRSGVAARVVPLALEERWFRPLMMPRLLEYEGFTGGRIAERIEQAFE